MARESVKIRMMMCISYGVEITICLTMTDNVICIYAQCQVDMSTCHQITHARMTPVLQLEFCELHWHSLGLTLTCRSIPHVHILRAHLCICFCSHCCQLLLLSTCTLLSCSHLKLRLNPLLSLQSINEYKWWVCTHILSPSQPGWPAMYWVLSAVVFLMI